MTDLIKLSSVCEHQCERDIFWLIQALCHQTTSKIIAKLKNPLKWLDASGVSFECTYTVLRGGLIKQNNWNCPCVIGMLGFLYEVLIVLIQWPWFSPVAPYSVSCFPFRKCKNPPAALTQTPDWLFFQSVTQSFSTAEDSGLDSSFLKSCHSFQCYFWVVLCTPVFSNLYL